MMSTLTQAQQLVEVKQTGFKYANTSMSAWASQLERFLLCELMTLVLMPVSKVSQANNVS